MLRAQYQLTPTDVRSLFLNALLGDVCNTFAQLKFHEPNRSGHKFASRTGAMILPPRCSFGRRAVTAHHPFIVVSVKPLCVCICDDGGALSLCTVDNCAGRHVPFSGQAYHASSSTACPPSPTPPPPPPPLLAL